MVHGSLQNVSKCAYDNMQYARRMQNQPLMCRTGLGEMLWTFFQRHCSQLGGPYEKPSRFTNIFFFVNCGRPCVVNNLDWTILRHPTSSWIILLSVTWRNSSVIKKMAQKKRQRTLAAIGYGYGNPVHLLYNWIISSISIQPTRCQREHTCPDLRVGGSPSPQSGKEEVHHYWEISHQSSESCHQVQKPIKKTDQYKLRSCAEHGYLAQIGLPFIRQTSGHFLRWPTQANHLTLHTESPKQDPPHMSLFNPNPHFNFDHLFILGSYWSKTDHFPKSRIGRWFQSSMKSMKNMIISNPCPNREANCLSLDQPENVGYSYSRMFHFLATKLKPIYLGEWSPIGLVYVCNF